MRHIVKKGIFQHHGPAVLPENTKVFENLDQNVLKEKTEMHDFFISTENGHLIKAFIYNLKGYRHPIPFPDLTLVYFDAAYNLNVQRKEYENEILKPAESNESFGNIEFHSIYRYYGYASTCLISLFTALESFVNDLIPNDGYYEKVDSKCIQKYDKEQIQKHLTFDEKTKKVLPYFFGNKSFFEAHPKISQHIINLKDLRDNIVHPKSSQNHKLQEELIKKILKFAYDESFNSVKEFLNYYRPNFVEECDCSIDY